MRNPHSKKMSFKVEGSGYTDRDKVTEEEGRDNGNTPSFSQKCSQVALVTRFPVQL